MTQLFCNLLIHTLKFKSNIQSNFKSPHLTYDHLFEFLQSRSIVEHRCYLLLSHVQVLDLASGGQQHRPLEDDQLPEVPGPGSPETVQTLLHLDTVAHTPNYHPLLISDDDTQEYEPSEWTLHVGDDSHSLDPDPLGDLHEDIGELLCLLEGLLVTTLAPLDIHHQLIDPLRHLTVTLSDDSDSDGDNLLADDGGHDQPKTSHGARDVPGGVHDPGEQESGDHGEVGGSQYLLVSGTQVFGLTRDTTSDILHYGPNLFCQNIFYETDFLKK